MIHKQFLSRDGNATILPPLHCHRQKSIARVSVALVLQCFLYAHAFKMASCVTPLLLYYKAVFLDFCSQYKHNDGITFSPDLELKTSFCLYSINLFRKWLRKLVKWNVKLLLECLEIKF